MLAAAAVEGGGGQSSLARSCEAGLRFILLAAALAGRQAGAEGAVRTRETVNHSPSSSSDSDEEAERTRQRFRCATLLGSLLGVR